MNGKNLFEGLSFIDERYIDEAENSELPGTAVSPWIRVAAMAACLCVVMLSLWCLRPFRPVSPDPPVETTLPIMPEGFQTVIVSVEEMTDTGFTGTVAEQMFPELFEIGRELNVVITEETVYEPADYTGCHVWVEFIQYDSDTAVIVADFIEVVPQSEHTD